MQQFNRIPMKNLLYLLFGMILMLGLNSCGEIPSMNPDDFDVNLMYGRWQEGTVFERYDDTGLGATWDVGDDVEEEEAQLFKWSLDGSTLIHEHIGTFVTVPKVYTVTTLNSSQLTYHDDYGNTHYFSKVD